MRLYPPSWWFAGLREDDDIQGHAIKAGDHVWIVAYLA